jgi:hypothetical protein
MEKNHLRALGDFGVKSEIEPYLALEDRQHARRTGP